MISNSGVLNKQKSFVACWPTPSLKSKFPMILIMAVAPSIDPPSHFRTMFSPYPNVSTIGSSLPTLSFWPSPGCESRPQIVWTALGSWNSVRSYGGFKPNPKILHRIVPPNGGLHLNSLKQQLANITSILETLWDFQLFLKSAQARFFQSILTNLTKSKTKVFGN